MTLRFALRGLISALFACFVVQGGVHAADAGPAIAAASDLKFALEEIARQFTADTGEQVRLTFGSSGNFVRQIEQGAPFELFLSADEALVERLAGRGLTQDAGRLYAIGRLALFVPTGSPVKPAGDLSGLRAAIAAGQVRRFAIANPELAPYGRAAQQALQQAKLWEPLQGSLVIGENVSQAAQFASNGDAQGGLIAHSLALASELQARGRFELVPEASHAPLRQRMVLLKSATPAARRFYEYMQVPAARGIMTRYGFTLPANESR